MSKAPAITTRGPGRPLTGDAKMTSRTFRATPDQLAKLDALGGSEWIRKKIDAAKDPRA